MRIWTFAITLAVAGTVGSSFAADHHTQETPVPATAASSPPPKKHWTTSLGAGYTMSRGNSNSTNLNVNFHTLWDPKTVRTFKAEFLYIVEDDSGEEDDVDKSSALVRYERRLSTKNRYWFGETSYSRDRFKDIAFLISPRVGVGRSRTWRKEKIKLGIDLSAGMATEQNLAGTTGTGGAAQIGQTLDLAFGTSKINQKTWALFKTGDFNDTIYHLDIGITSTIAKHFDVKITYIFEYKSQPDFGDVLNSDSSLVTTLLVKW